MAVRGAGPAGSRMGYCKLKWEMDTGKDALGQKSCVPEHELGKAEGARTPQRRSECARGKGRSDGAG